jgi:hypothetical protein
VVNQYLIQRVGQVWNTKLLRKLRVYWVAAEEIPFFFDGISYRDVVVDLLL